MRRATLAGAIVAPPTPAFYVDVPAMDRFLDAYCVRAARLLGLELPGERLSLERDRGRRSAGRAELERLSATACAARSGRRSR